MSRIFDKKTHKFINPNRTRVRFYSKLYKRYYTVWINKGLIMTNGRGAAILMCETLYKETQRMARVRKKTGSLVQPVTEWNFNWEIKKD